MLGPYYNFGNKNKLPVFPNPHFSLHYQVPDNSTFEAEPTKVSDIKVAIFVLHASMVTKIIETGFIFTTH